MGNHPSVKHSPIIPALAREMIARHIASANAADGTNCLATRGFYII